MSTGDQLVQPALTRVARQDWLDLARGVAVVSMVVAHTSPAGGILNVSEYLTAPLFALLFGIALAFAWRNRRGSTGWFLAREFVRGVILIGLGLALEPVYLQVVVVLEALGILNLVLAPLVVALAGRPRAAAALAGLVALAAPPLTVASRAWLSGTDAPEALRMVVVTLAAHPNYRVLAFCVPGLLGVALAPWLARTGADAPRPRQFATLAVLASGLSGLALWLGRTSGWGGRAYDGTYPELAGSTLISLAALLGCAWLLRAAGSRVRHLVDPLVATGRLALTAYVLQLVILALVTRYLTDGVDDSWPVLLGLTVTLIAFCTVWRRLVRRPGPAEWLLRLADRIEPPRSQPSNPVP